MLLLHQLHRFLQPIPSLLHCANGVFRIRLPTDVLFLLFPKVVDICCLSPQVEHNFSGEVVDLRQLSVYLLLALKHFLAPLAELLETSSQCLVSLCKRVLHLLP
jgi:hypothetical protein